MRLQFHRWFHTLTLELVHATAAFRVAMQRDLFVCLLLPNYERSACRSTFPGMPIYLCRWHVVKAMLTQLRGKLANKQRHQEVWQELHALVNMPPQATQEATRQSMDFNIELFKDKYRETEPALVRYFENQWEGKKGVTTKSVAPTTDVSWNACQYARSCQKFFLSR